MTVAYLDHAATTPLRPDVAAAMAEVLAGPLGNPTGSHPPAQRARRLLEEARDEVSALVGRDAGEVVFTSGGTESAVLAVLGTVEAALTGRRSASRHGEAASHDGQATSDDGQATSDDGEPASDDGEVVVLASAVEHPAVRESCRAAGRLGADTRELPVDRAGVVDIDALTRSLSPDVVLVAVMAANNETGVVQPVGTIVDAVRRRALNAVVFTDAVQAAPYLDIAEWCAGADLVSLSAHKVGGPVGVGVLVVGPAVTLSARQPGGGQERERRSGTQDVVGAVGLATALRAAANERVATAARVSALRDRLAAGLLEAVPGAERTVPPGAQVLPGHFHLCLPGIEREELLVALGMAGVCASGGSSCASGALEPSHVLAAMGVPRNLADGAVRFTLGPSTTEAEVDHALAVVPDVVASLRGCS